MTKATSTRPTDARRAHDVGASRRIAQQLLARLPFLLFFACPSPVLARSSPRRPGAKDPGFFSFDCSMSEKDVQYGAKSAKKGLRRSEADLPNLFLRKQLTRVGGWHDFLPKSHTAETCSRSPRTRRAADWACLADSDVWLSVGVVARLEAMERPLVRSPGDPWLPPETREGRRSTARSEYQRVTFSPPRTGASSPRSGSDAWRTGAARSRVGTASSRDGYTYQFSPEPSQSPRRWSPLPRTGRGWSQFSAYADMKAARSPTPLPDVDFKHPVHPDLAPSHFWKLLADIRETPVLPTALPQIVPKLDLSRVPTGSGGKGIPLWNKAAAHSASRRAPEQKDSIARPGRGGYSRAIRLNSGLRTPQTERTPSRSKPKRQGDGSESEFVASTVNEKRRIVATDEEIMGLQHRKLGINPRGRVWDLRRQLNDDDRTLQITQVAAAILGNKNLEVRFCAARHGAKIYIASVEFSIQD